MPKSLTSKLKKTSAQIKEAKNQTTRLLILAVIYLDCWFVIKLESVLRVEFTVINPVIECSDELTINGLIEKLFTVRANTYNVLGSAAFWGESWLKTQNIIAAKCGSSDTYLVNGLPLPAKIFEWTVQDTAKNILAQQSAAKTAIISRIYQRFPLHQGEKLTPEQKAKNQESEANRKLALDALKSFETIKQIPWLHRYFREEYKRGHAKQNRQIVYQPQAYNCTRISRYLVKLEVQGLARGKRISLIVKSNRIITGQIRLIRNASGSLEIHSFVTLYNRDYGQLIYREEVKAVDRGYTEVFYTDDNQLLGKGFGQQLNKKTARITRIGRNKNKLWALAHVRYKDNPQKSRKIRENNLGSKTELKRRQRDDAYVETVVNQACRSITFQAKTLGVESLVESIHSTKKLSRRAKNRLEKWEKGTVADPNTARAERNCRLGRAIALPNKC
ncbi:hypothetical protein F7734_45820 [Scytonema sp. UIC 10036]|uniref:hypothetical protein n=1 Tax=Scytonema sp. UIC 10036 TaxID=2304196 RepID=UPI0012DA9996|nr:hypothetical protein [Scytonema sp. UIC 10036]MUG99225.1 hypothetical protein [Scytonema sp. UIC 10036]